MSENFFDRNDKQQLQRVVLLLTCVMARADVDCDFGARKDADVEYD